MSSEATTPAPTTTGPFIGLFRFCGTLGNVGMPGAPISHFQLLVHPADGTVSGIVHVTQAIEGPESDIKVSVTGKIHKTGFGPVQTLLLLSGDFTTSTPPPSIAVIKGHYTAHMVLTGNPMEGKGGFEYLGKRIEDVPVKSTPC